MLINVSETRPSITLGNSQMPTSGIPTRQWNYLPIFPKDLFQNYCKSCTKNSFKKLNKKIFHPHSSEDFFCNFFHDSPILSGFLQFFLQKTFAFVYARYHETITRRIKLELHKKRKNRIVFVLYACDILSLWFNYISPYPAHLILPHFLIFPDYSEQSLIKAWPNAPHPSISHLVSKPNE